MPLPRKLRFDVFKRDSFSCQYCGKTPPLVTLEVDHIKPKSKNGTDVIDNLITSCFDCNRGKSNIELSTLPQQTNDKIELIKEKEDQYRQYQKLLSGIEKRLRLEINEVSIIYSRYFPEYELSDGFKNVSVKNFISKMGKIAVCDAMEKACNKTRSDRHSIKYFCGICWNIIKGKGYG